MDKAMLLLEIGLMKRLLMKNLLAMALISVALLGCGRKPIDLSGNWELTLPKGAKFSSPIERLSENTYRIPALQLFSGVYELRGDKLAVTAPKDRRLTEFVWKVEDANKLTLIEAPSTGKIGSDY